MAPAQLAKSLAERFYSRNIERLNCYKTSENISFLSCKTWQNVLSYHLLRLSDRADTVKDGKRLRGQAVKTSPFHGGNTGSIPVGVSQGFMFV